MIEIQQVWKSYGLTQVLERVSTVINTGEFVALVGSSGCGKSTFLKMLLGVESVSKGVIQIDGKTIASEPGRDRGIVFQQYSVFPHLTVLQNVVAAIGLNKSGLTGKLFGHRRLSAIKESHGMLEKVGLSHVTDSYPHELSGGMQQRLAIAQTLMAKPSVLLLDEPFAALDPGIRSDMHKLLLPLWRDEGLTVVMVTHSLKEAFTLGTRVIVFDKVQYDPNDYNAYGATITYDLEAGENRP